ncbi:MAG: hypothetical protein LUD02_12700 [Tannerellaceae bacterium]|nr:hypothetical protein [Tannerellaceae bacterium]
MWGLYNYVVDIGKTAYDPCPYGWRVPTVSSSSSPWWGASGWQYNSSFIGVDHTTYGYWPMTGYRHGETGAIGGMDSSTQLGIYWHAWSNQSVATGLGFTQSGTSINADTGGSYYRARGAAVRCMKYTE